MDILSLNIGIIGSGKVGLSIAKRLIACGARVKIVAVSDSSFNRALAHIPADNILRKIADFTISPDLILICAPDNNISSIDIELSNRFGENLSGKFIAHTSGILSSDLLEKCRSFGAISASVHPYQTFAEVDSEIISGSAWAIESEFDTTVFSDLVELIGGNSTRINKTDKVLYHLSAVSASNYFNACLALSKLAAKQALIDFKAFAEPIVKTTYENSFKLASEDVAFPLTGPIARGDYQAVEAHIFAVKDKPAILKPYCYFAMATLELALSSGIIDKIDADKIRKILKTNIERFDN
jgi:predicted short-subunit dehydrogenase-like oxidoreductase (DUF2520 family)